MLKRLITLCLTGFVAMLLSGCFDTQASITKECVEAYIAANGPYKGSEERRGAISEGYIYCMGAWKGR